jgi:hypothetical protein
MSDRLQSLERLKKHEEMNRTAVEERCFDGGDATKWYLDRAAQLEVKMARAISIARGEAPYEPITWMNERTQLFLPGWYEDRTSIAGVN